MPLRLHIFFRIMYASINDDFKHFILMLHAAKRAADLEKLRELDRFRLEVETLSEFRAKVLESQAALQRDLKKVRESIFSGVYVCALLNKIVTEISSAIS